MATNKDIENKCKRVRMLSQKKWTVPEEKSLLEFLMENRDIEKPTAQVYYRRFSNEKNVEVEWKQVRSKVRNLRVSYNKAKAWEGSTGAGSMDGETIKCTLKKMCIHFDELDEIFGSHNVLQFSIIEDSLGSNENLFNPTVDDTTVSDTSMAENIPTSKKGIYSRTAVSDIMSVQADMMKIKREKFEHEKLIKEKEIIMKEKEIKLKEREVELKAKEIENQKELKILELQMNERLAMEELKLKYKNK